MNRTLSRSLFLGPIYRMCLQIFLVFLALTYSPADLPAAPAGSEKAGELFENGGFEKGIAGWRPLNMSGSTTFVVDKQVKQSGSQSLRIERTGHGRADFLKHSAKLPITKSKLEVSLGYRVDKKARIQVDFYFFDDASNTIGKGYMPVVNSGATKGFKKVSKTFDVPDGASGCGINVVISKPGKVWLDDVSVSLRSSKKKSSSRNRGKAGELEDGGFETGLEGWMPIDGGSGSTTIDVDGRVKASGKKALRLTRTSPRLFPPDGLELKIVRRGKEREITIEYKTRTDDQARAVVSLAAVSGDGVFLGAMTGEPITALRTFQRQKLSLSVPLDAERFFLSLSIQGRGTVWFDDLRLRRK